MATKPPLFRCYLVTNLLNKYRFVPVFYDQIIDRFLQRDERFIYTIAFPEGFAQGALLELMARFGMKQTAQFITQLLEGGFTAVMPHYAAVMKDPHTPIELPSPLTEDNVHMIEYLEEVYKNRAFWKCLLTETQYMGLSIVYKIPITSMCIGMHVQ